MQFLHVFGVKFANGHQCLKINLNSTWLVAKIHETHPTHLEAGQLRYNVAGPQLHFDDNSPDLKEPSKSEAPSSFYAELSHFASCCNHGFLNGFSAISLQFTAFSYISLFPAEARRMVSAQRSELTLQTKG